MKRLTKMFLSACAVTFALCAANGLTAFAAETPGGAQPKSVNITVVMPDRLTKEEEPAPESATEPPAAPVASTVTVLYPVDVTETREGGGRQIVKTYELNFTEKPADIPRADFERGGWTYTLTDIIKREMANTETRPHTETVTLNTGTKDLEKILPQLAQTIEYKSEDEFVGVLTLDVASIKVETAGTKTTSYEMKVTREYPRLSAADTSLVPKTVTENGKTYTLAGVDWKAGNFETVDYEQVAEYYTAYATYTATGSSTKVTGYVTTAVYNGTLAKLSQGKTVYTAYFEGTEIRTPLEMTSAGQFAPPNAEQGAKNVAGAGSEVGGDTTGAEQSEAAEPTGVTETETAEQAASAPTETAEPAKSTETVTEQPAETSSAEPTAETTAEPTAEPAAPDKDGGSSNAALYVVIAVLAVLLGGAIFYIMKRGNSHDEKTTETGGTHADAGDDDGDTDLRG